MGIDEFQPASQMPDIRKVPQRPETPGKIPPSPDTDSVRHDTEIEEGGDPTTIKTPQVPTPEISEKYVPDLDDEDDKGDERKQPPRPALH